MKHPVGGPIRTGSHTELLVCLCCGLRSVACPCSGPVASLLRQHKRCQQRLRTPPQPALSLARTKWLSSRNADEVVG
jgi:L-lactate utilization protein LutB